MFPTTISVLYSITPSPKIIYHQITISVFSSTTPEYNNPIPTITISALSLITPKEIIKTIAEMQIPLYSWQNNLIK
jgi:hypothetical protein